MLKQYRMRPVIKEAMRFTDLTTRDGILQWMRDNDTSYSATQHTITIPTHMGKMDCNEGDWVVRGLEGEFYPINDSKFQETYEEIA
jgi:hypothetical protein